MCSNKIEYGIVFSEPLGLFGSYLYLEIEFHSKLLGKVAFLFIIPHQQTHTNRVCFSFCFFFFFFVCVFFVCSHMMIF